MEKVKLLEERIKKDGKALGKTVLKVDSFINHQVDSEFMDALGKDFAEHFKETDFQNFKRKSISDKSDFLYKRNKL